jgi:hypothetical protein
MSQGAIDVGLNPQIYLSVSQASSLTIPVKLVWILMNVRIVQNPHAIVIRSVKIYKEVSSAHARLASSLTLFFRPVLTSMNVR